MIVLSLGAGVQSTTLSLMAACGEVTPMPTFAVFADTGWEPRSIYAHLKWLETQLPYPIVRVKKEGVDLGLLSVEVANGVRPRREALPPWYVSNPNTILPKQCTKEFKSRVVTKYIRGRLGLSYKERAPKNVFVEHWLGISSDEMSRMKDHEVKYFKNRWPLIEKNMDREACLLWMQKHGFPKPGKSSCVFCPYKSREQWKEMAREAPEDFEDACALDEAIRNGYAGMRGSAYVHKDRLPLREAVRKTVCERDYGFEEECDGICGL